MNCYSYFLKTNLKVDPSHQALFESVIYKIKMANCTQKECDEILFGCVDELLKDGPIDEEKLLLNVDQKLSSYRKWYREWIDFFMIEFILAGIVDVLYSSLVTSNWTLTITPGFVLRHLCLYVLIKGLFSVLSKGFSSVVRLVWIIVFFMAYMSVSYLQVKFDQGLFSMSSILFVLVLGLLAYFSYVKGNR